MNKELLQNWLLDLRTWQGKRCDAYQEGQKYCPLGRLAALNGFEMQPYKPAVVLGKPMLQEYAGKVTDGYRWPKTAENWPSPAVAMRITDMSSCKEGGKHVYSWTEIADYVQRSLMQN